MLKLQTGIRLTTDLAVKIRTHRDLLRSLNPGLSINTADAIRDLLQRGFEIAQGDGDGRHLTLRGA